METFKEILASALEQLMEQRGTVTIQSNYRPKTFNLKEFTLSAHFNTGRTTKLIAEQKSCFACSSNDIALGYMKCASELLKNLINNGVQQVSDSSGEPAL